MIYLIVLVTFFSSVGKEPFTALARAPSAEACATKAAQQAVFAEKDPEVSGYLIKCITVPIKS